MYVEMWLCWMQPHMVTPFLSGDSLQVEELCEQTYTHITTVNSMEVTLNGNATYLVHHTYVQPRSAVLYLKFSEWCKKFACVTHCLNVQNLDTLHVRVHFGWGPILGWSKMFVFYFLFLVAMEHHKPKQGKCLSKLLGMNMIFLFFLNAQQPLTRHVSFPS